MFVKKFLLIFCCLMNCANAAEIYKFDPNQTSVNWSVNHFGFSSPSGKFTDVSGSILIDEKNPHNSAVDVLVKIDSLNTGFAKFDSYLKGANFFNIKKFPTAKFTSISVVVTGKNKAQVFGNLILHGVMRPVVLEVRLNKIGIGVMTQRKTIGFSASGIIKRSQFGLPGIFDNVKLLIEAEGILAAPDSK